MPTIWDVSFSDWGEGTNSIETKDLLTLLFLKVDNKKMVKKMVDNKKSYGLIFVLVIVALAYFALAFTPDTSVSNAALISPIMRQNISGSFLLNVSSGVYFGGNAGNLTNVTVSFWNSSDRLVYIANLTDKNIGVNQTFNVTLSSSAIFLDGFYNISLNSTNASDGAFLFNNSVFKSASQFIFIDNTVPNVTINTPVARFNYTTGGTIVFNATVFNISGTAIDRVIFQIGNTTVFNETASQPDVTLFNTSVAVANMRDGNWTVTVYANDTAGNLNSSVSTTFVVDTTAPGIPTLVNMTNRYNASDSTPTFSWSVNDSLTSTLLCNLSINSAVNVSGISSANSTVTNYTLTTALAQGNHNWSVTCTDSVLLSNTSISNNFTIDSLGTVSSIASVNSKTTTGSWSNNRALSIVFSANDSNIHYWNISVFNSTGGIANSSQQTTGNLSAQSNLTVGYDDNFTVNLTVVDYAVNSNVSSFVLKVDTANPSVGTVSVTGITSSGGTLTIASADGNSGVSSCSYSGAGTGTIIGNTATLSGLTASTAYTVTASCSDTAGNTATGTADFTTDRISSGGGSTGSSGSATAGVVGEFAKEVWTSINQGETATVEVENGEIGFTQVDFKLKETVWGPWVKVEKKETLPSNVDSLDKKVYKYVEVTTGVALKDNVFESPVISFKVKKTWLAENSVAKENMALFRYVDGKWVELATTLGQDDGTYVHYTAVTPGFSYFAIGQSATGAVAGAAVETGDVGAGAVPPTLGAEDVQAEEVAGEAGEAGDVQKGKNILVWILGIGLLGLLIGLSVWYSSRQQKTNLKKPSFEIKRRR
ncbi:PGF-pre-PGF domain-containing protein [Candidatus Woesearchaeota archaeon]|nr:PGF-pre-PGF domain-containing protein [Candidatus Woesearchaeota archaeon]